MPFSKSLRRGAWTPEIPRPHDHSLLNRNMLRGDEMCSEGG
jgi:hypothetical protein